MPSKTMDIKSRLIRKMETDNNGIKIMFDPIVRVTRSNPTMDIMTLFSNIGGCLGLTLGYSILQLVEKMDILLQFGWKKILQRAAQLYETPNGTTESYK